MAEEGWGWLAAMPPHWVAPARLRAPTASPSLNLAVQMLGSNKIGNDLIEAVAQFMIAHAQLELWIGRHEPPLSFRQKFAIGQVTSGALRSAYESWVTFEEAHDAARGKVGMIQAERSALFASIRESTDVVARATEVID